MVPRASEVKSSLEEALVGCSLAVAFHPWEDEAAPERRFRSVEALAEAAVDAVYGALVAATLEEWAGASTDNPVSAADARGPGLECQDCFENFYKEYDVEPWLWRRAMREGWSELGGWSREEMEAEALEKIRREGEEHADRLGKVAFLKTRKEEKGEKIQRKKQWFKAFEGVDESDAERGHERREQS